MGLNIRGHESGQPVQEYATLAKTFAMIGNIEHGCVDILRLAQAFDGTCKDIIRFYDGVIISVDNLLVRAIRKFSRSAIWRKLCARTAHHQMLKMLKRVLR